MNIFTRGLTVVIATLVLLTIPTLEGYSSGIHNQASNGCTCHYSGSAPTINHNFPTTYNGGQAYTIQISVTGGVSGSGGGFNVVVDKGTLSTPGMGIMAVKVDSSGLSATHTTSSYRSWSFDWTAPSTGSGTVDVEIAAITANANNANSGDAWTTTSSWCCCLAQSPFWGTRALQQAPAVQQPHMRAPRRGSRHAGHRASYRQLLDVDWRGDPTGGAATGAGGPSVS